jgi:hypothetical protein
MSRVGVMWMLGVGLLACKPDADPVDSGVDPDPQNCSDAPRAELRLSFLDHFSGQAIDGLEITICDVTEVTDSSGFVVLSMPIDSLTSVDLSGHAEYPPTRFVLRSPNLPGWAWVEEQAGGTLWLPRKVMSLVTLKQLELALGVEEDTSKARVSFQASPYGLGFDLAGTAEGARPFLRDVDYELAAGQTGESEFREGDTLGMQEGSIYFHNVEPGAATFGMRNATGQACAYMPAMEEGSSWQTDLEAGVHTILPFQCHDPQ